jgi:hypothetical protein
MGLLALCGRWPGIDEAKARKSCLAIALITIFMFYFFCLWGLVSPETFPGIPKKEISLTGLIRLWNVSNITIPMTSLISLIMIIIIHKRRPMFHIALPVIFLTLLDVGFMRYDLFLQNISHPREMSPTLKKNIYGEGWTLVEFPYLLPHEMNILYPNHPLENGRMVLNQYNPLILRSISRYLGMNDQGRISHPNKILSNKGISSAFGIQRAVLCKLYRTKSNDHGFLAKRFKPGMIEMPPPEKIGVFTKTLEYRNLWIGADETGAEIEAESRTLIVFRILSYPGWKLYIDGKEADFIKANGCFLGARALEGLHSYEWRFRPTYFKTGIYLCIAAFSIMTLLLIFDVKMHIFNKTSKIGY